MKRQSKLVHSHPSLDSDPATLADTVPRLVREFLGRPPLISCESEVLYWAMIASLAEWIAPTDLLTWFQIKDVVDARIDIQRWRLLKAELISDDGQSATAEKSFSTPELDETYEAVRRACREYSEPGLETNYQLPPEIERLYEEGQNSSMLTYPSQRRSANWPGCLSAGFNRSPS